MSAIHLPNFISLNEAITLRAFGEATTANQELILHKPKQDRLLRLLDLCLAEASADARYSRFPRRLPSRPLPVLIERLDDVRGHWPPSTSALHSTAIELDHQSADHIKHYDAALHEILDQVAQGRRKMFGRIAPHPASPVAFAEPTYCLGPVTIGHNFRDVGPAGSLECPTAGAILHTKPGLLPILYDVMVEKEKYVFTHRPLDTTGSNNTQAEIDDWYRSERSILHPAPSREDDWQALRDKFPSVKKRKAVVRALREKYLETKPGPKQSRTKKDSARPSPK